MRYKGVDILPCWNCVSTNVRLACTVSPLITVQCNRCGHEGPPDTTPETAVAAWNAMPRETAPLTALDPRHQTALTQETMMTFHDALRIARGCLDYGGGYRSDQGKLDVFHHGIRTVINALEAAGSRGFEDTQVAALHRMGRVRLCRACNAPAKDLDSEYCEEHHEAAMQVLRGDHP